MGQPPLKDGKLDQLTALRFFAALMIVVHHGESIFGEKTVPVNWGQGVSFFFVLSGFILTYVYPQLDTLHDTKRFLRARVARIWPAHIACFVLGFILIPYAWETPTAIANLLLVHAWVPESKFYFSYNAVSWSVSTEVFFYLAFPLLIFRWRTTWAIKFFIACIALASLLWLVDRLHLPAYGGLPGEGGSQITQHGAVYISPISRIFEFVLGMVAATIWRKVRRPLSPWLSSLMEAGALALCGAAMWFGNDVAQVAQRLFANEALTLWLVHSGSLFAFAVLILVMANGGGIVSRVLTTPVLVLAGEISFSMYLLHQILLSVVARNLPYLTNVEGAPLAIGFMITLLALSYLMWVWVEVPGRRFLLSNGEVHGSSALKQSWNRHLPTGRRSIIAGALSVALIGAFLYCLSSNSGLVASDGESARLMTPERYRSNIDSHFGGIVSLAGADIQCDGSTLRMKLAWQKLAEQTVSYTNAVHFVDAAGKIGSQADYPVPKGVADLSIGDYWVDKVDVPLSRIPGNTEAVAIGVYDPAGSLLHTDHGQTDWDGGRLLFRLDGCGSFGR